MSDITKKAQESIKSQKERAQKFQNLYTRFKNSTEPISLGSDEMQMIFDALYSAYLREARDAAIREEAIECGSEDGNLNSHNESMMLDGCISLLMEAGYKFREYLDFVGFKPDGEEEKLKINMSVSHIVNRLFLYHTLHSGGTSTYAKCRLLGREPDEQIDICEDDDTEEDENE